MFVWMTCYFVDLLLVCCLLFALGVGLDCFDYCCVAGCLVWFWWLLCLRILDLEFDLSV